MKIINFKTTHRKYPDINWNYKAISARIEENNKLVDVYFYTLENKGKQSSGIEVYSGRNYIVDSNDNSYSRSYTLEKFPSKYNNLIGLLKEKHLRAEWSKADKVDLN
jgi:hypothetical protein